MTQTRCQSLVNILVMTRIRESGLLAETVKNISFQKTSHALGSSSLIWRKKKIQKEGRVLVSVRQGS